MAIPLNLRDIQSGFLTATAFTQNNTLIEEALQKALNREGGANNEMLANLDMGLNNIINVENLDVNSITVDGVDYETYLTNIVNSFLGDVQLIADAAQQSADDAASSAASSLSSAQDASNSASAALTSEQNASTSESNTQALLEDFRSRYYGTDTSDPALDPNGNTPTEGDLYYNTQTNMLRVRANGIWVNVPESPVFNVFGRFGNIVAESGDYTADQITYNNTSSGLTAVEVQAAIDEVESRVDTAEGNISTNSTDISNHIEDEGNPHNTTATQVGADPEGTAQSLISAHESAADPHSQYTTEAEVEVIAPQAPGILDGLRRSVEAASGGRMTVFYTASGQPSYFVRQCKFLCEDIAPGGELGTGVHEAFVFGGQEDAEIWVGAYQAAIINGEAVSQPGLAPHVSITYDSARSACQTAGAGFDLQTHWDWAAIMHWCMANGFEPRGNTNHGRHHDMRKETGTRQDNLAPGNTDGIGNILLGSGPASWRHDNSFSGISDLVGNVWEWMSGFKMVDGRIFLAADNDIPAEAAYIDSGFNMPTNRTWSTVDTTGASELLKRAGIVPKGIEDPTGHLYTTLTGERLPFRGGDRIGSGNAGLGALYLGLARTYASSGIGFRPRYRVT